MFIFSNMLVIIGLVFASTGHAGPVGKLFVTWSQGQPRQAASYRIYLCESPITISKRKVSCKGTLHERESRVPMAEVLVPVEGNKGTMYVRTSAVGYDGKSSGLSEQVSMQYDATVVFEKKGR